MKEYRVYIDENLPAQIARGLNKLQQPQNARDGMHIEILSIKDVFGEGAKDEDWIPKVGKMNGIVITKDYRIQSIKHQRELYKEHGLGISFLALRQNLALPIGKWSSRLSIVGKKSSRSSEKHTSICIPMFSKKDFENIDDE
jgi:hypothetical protein